MNPDFRAARWRPYLPYLAWLLPLAATAWAVSIPLSAPAPGALSRDETEPRFGVPRPERERIWRDISANDGDWRRAGREAFPDHPWSQHDHYAAFLLKHMAMLAARTGLSISQVALIFDEGVHSRWPAPNGKPVDATWVPLQPRQQ